MRWFPADKTLVVINNSTQKKSTVVKTPDGDIAVELDGLETKISHETSKHNVRCTF